MKTNSQFSLLAEKSSSEVSTRRDGHHSQWQEDNCPSILKSEHISILASHLEDKD